MGGSKDPWLVRLDEFLYVSDVCKELVHSLNASGLFVVYPDLLFQHLGSMPKGTPFLEFKFMELNLTGVLIKAASATVAPEAVKPFFVQQSYERVQKMSKFLLAFHQAVFPGHSWK